VIAKVGGAGAAVVVVADDVDVVVDEVVVGDDVAVLVGGRDGEPSAESPGPQPTNTTNNVTVHLFDAIASTSTTTIHPRAIGAQEAKCPPISAHMR
jgi:hypothetical protein